MSKHAAARHWTLDPDVSFLNHGSFGACPAPVLATQSAWRERMEAEPVRFLGRDITGLIDEARIALASFLGADPAGLALVPNATTGVNTVLRSLCLEPTDEILLTNHGYGACNNAADFVAERAGARVAIAHVPFPIDDPNQVVDAVLAAVTERTKLALIDHITSPTGLVFPIERIVRELDARGIDTLVDGAHAPGMLALELDALGAAYYTGNCHKWLCAPKGSAFLQVREDRRAHVRPLVISHGARVPAGQRSRFHLEADWTGTCDPTAWLSISAAIQFGRDLLPGGWPAWRAHNRALALEARSLLCAALDLAPPAPASMIGSLVSLPLPAATQPSEPPLFLDALHRALFDDHGIEIPVMPWPAPPNRLLRASAQIYNELADYRNLVTAIRAELGSA